VVLDRLVRIAFLFQAPPHRRFGDVQAGGPLIGGGAAGPRARARRASRARRVLRTRAASEPALRYLTMKLPGASRRNGLTDLVVWITGRSRKAGARSTYDSGWSNDI